MSNITAEQMVELKKAEKDFEVQMKQLDVDVYSLEVDDRKDARSKFSGDWTPTILGTLSKNSLVMYSTSQRSLYRTQAMISSCLLLVHLQV